MIEVEQLSRRFGDLVAVDGISFRVNQGEVVGFLGRNGAGKTTTMRILACYMPATSGRAAVAGFDVFTHSLEVRRRIGYMPENYPFYPEMRVREFLDFRARLRGIRPKARRKDRIDTVMGQCRVTDLADRVIGQLSKGQRQRTALAEVLLHEPPILILDEPTAGLDPGQIRQTRELIRNLASRHTVLLSTHILPEVEAVCDRVLIVEKGRLVLDERLDALQARQETDARVRLEIRGPADAAAEAIRGVAGVASVNPDGAGNDGLAAFEIVPAPGGDPREAVGKLCAERGWPVREIHRRTRTLEQIFLETIGEAG